MREVIACSLKISPLIKRKSPVKSEHCFANNEANIYAD